MRQQLLERLPAMSENDGGAPARPIRHYGPLRGGCDPFDGGEGMLKCGGCGCCCFIVFIFLMSSLASLAPNEFGVCKNSFTGNVDDNVYHGGLHLLGPLKSFIKYPATQVTLQFSGVSGIGYDRPAVKTRTGGASKDGKGGGQPISITCALQYVFIQDLLPHVFKHIGTNDLAKERYVTYAENMVSNTALNFVPESFWKNRTGVAKEMLAAINQTLFSDGGVEAVRFEIMKVDFAKSYEDSITQVQVALEGKEVNKYEQKVQEVVQSIEVLRAQNEADIARIDATARSLAKQQIGNASRDAFNMKQAMKAQKYGEFAKQLSLNSTLMAEFFKIKSIQQRPSKSSKVVVGLSGIADEL